MPTKKKRLDQSSSPPPQSSQSETAFRVRKVPKTGRASKPARRAVMGRPTLYNETRRAVGIRLPESEIAMLTELTEARGLSQSALIGELIRDAYN